MHGGPVVRPVGVVQRKKCERVARGWFLHADAICIRVELRGPGHRVLAVCRPRRRVGERQPRLAHAVQVVEHGQRARVPVVMHRIAPTLQVPQYLQVLAAAARPLERFRAEEHAGDVGR